MSHRCFYNWPQYILISCPCLVHRLLILVHVLALVNAKLSQFKTNENFLKRKTSPTMLITEPREQGPSLGDLIVYVTLWSSLVQKGVKFPNFLALKHITWERPLLPWSDKLPGTNCKMSGITSKINRRFPKLMARDKVRFAILHRLTVAENIFVWNNGNTSTKITHQHDQSRTSQSHFQNNSMMIFSKWFHHKIHCLIASLSRVTSKEIRIKCHPCGLAKNNEETYFKQCKRYVNDFFFK